MKNILRKSNFSFTKWCVALIATFVTLSGVAQAQVKISQVYGAGGNSGAVYNADYVELYNAGATAQSLSGWSIQYASKTGTSWAVASLSGTINPGKYFLISLATGATGSALPTPDLAGPTTVNLSGTDGKVALANSITAFSGLTPTGAIDFVGFGTASAYEGTGAAPAPSAANAIFRAGNGATDTNDNKANFSAAAAAPRNSSSGGDGSTPTITLNPATPNLSAFTTTAGTASAVQTFAVTGSNLTADVTVTAPAGFEVSQDGTSFASSQTLAKSGTTLASKTISVRIAASTAEGSLAPSNVTLTSAGATTANVAVSGTVKAANAATISTGGSLTSFSSYFGFASATQTFTVSGSNLTESIVVVAPTGYQVSLDGTSFSSTRSISPSGGSVTSTTVHVRVSASAVVGAANGSITLASAGVDPSVAVAVTGTVTTPVLSVALSPTTVAENAGASASTGTVSLPAGLVAPASGLAITLLSSDTTEATVPSSVTIAEGASSATFAVSAVTDSTYELLNQTSTITASRSGFTSGTAVLTVTNVDAEPILTISLTSLAADSYPQSFDALGTASIPSAISSTAGVQTSLAAVTGSTTLNGWYATKVDGSSGAATAITAGTGSGNSALVYSYGANGATDRALGVLAGGANWMAIGALIKNDTGATINSIKVSFTAEFWRSSTTTKNVLTCSVGKVDGSTITTGNFLTAGSATPLTSGNITGPAAVTTAAALNGNDVANQVAFTDVVIPLVLAAGETGFVRWSDVNDVGDDAGLAIDNLKMTASLDAAPSDGDGTVTIANNTPNSPYASSGIWEAGGSSQGVSVNVTPLLESTRLTSTSVLVPTEFGVPLVGNVTTSGGATGGTATVVGQLITLNGVTITKANPGVINIVGLSTPTTSTIGTGNGVYPFTVSTAGDGGTLKAVFASPAANVLIPIANIRDIDANGAPVDKNIVVAVEGICTAAPLGATSFMQDASYGIAVYPATTSPAFTLGMVAGRKYAVVGTLVDYNGIAQVKPASISGVVDLGVASIPTPITVTVAQAKAEQYESMLVTIAGLTKDAAETDPWAATKVITVKNSALEAIDVKIQSDSTATTEPAYPVTITGILQQNSSATPRALTYQIMPRTAGDLSFAPGLRLSFAEGYLYESTTPPLGGTPVSGVLTVSRTGGDTSGALVVALSASPTGLLQFPASVTILAGQESASVTVEAIDNSAFDAAGFTNVILTASALGSGLRDGSTTVIVLEDEASAPADTVRPLITLIGANPQSVANGGVYTDLKATVSDNVDAIRTITGTGAVNTAVQGDYPVTYNATDAAGNAAIQVTRTVRVAGPLGTTYSSWLNGASASDAAFLDYVFGAVTPGTLDPSLKPTVAVIGGNLVLTYYVRQGTAGLTVTPKTSVDLAAGPSGWVNVIPVDVGVPRDVNGVSVQEKTASVPVSGDRKFLRAEAVQQ